LIPRRVSVIRPRGRGAVLELLIFLVPAEGGSVILDGKKVGPSDFFSYNKFVVQASFDVNLGEAGKHPALQAGRITWEMRMYDVIVVGAGPSGLSAARRLKEKGLDVLVLEKKKKVGEHVICAGIVGQEAFERFDLSRESVLHEIKKIRIFSPLSLSLTYEHPKPLAYAVDRVRFDQYLTRETLEGAIDIRPGTEVQDVSVTDREVTVFTRREGIAHERYSARVVFLATGVHYNLHKKLGLGLPREFLHGIQAELELDPVDCTSVFLGRDIAPGAFAWLVPLNGRKVRLGLIAEKDPRGCFSRLVKRISPQSIGDMEMDKVQLKPIAQGLISRTYGDRVLALGEAAGQVKTTTGGGIYFGLICSEIAARVVLKAFSRGEFSRKELAEYERLWRKALRKEILIGYYARKVCSTLSDRQIDRVLRVIQTNGFISFLQDKGNFDWHSSLILHFFRRFPLWQVLRSRIGKNKGRPVN